jgi:hypothetical protein
MSRQAQGLELIVGVYDADAGPLGETRFIIGKMLGRSKCSLCDITHSPTRRKPEWDAMIERLDVPVRLLHRNQVPDSAQSLWAEHGLPAVVGFSGRQPQLLLTAAELDDLDGSVSEFEAALRLAVSRATPRRGGQGAKATSNVAIAVDTERVSATS